MRLPRYYHRGNVRLPGSPRRLRAALADDRGFSGARGYLESLPIRDGARRRLEVDTDEDGYPWLRCCYLSQCRTSRGHTLTHVHITPTSVAFRWNAGAPFTFELDGDTLRGKLSLRQWTIKFPMKRVTE